MSTFQEQFDALLNKYTELLVGEADQELVEKIKVWALYTYISKSMPPLVKHWNELHPDGKEEMMKIIGEIKQLNDQHRQQKQS
ncbi:YusU family protein [Bacillus sp. 31A1R]|uniref:YusU family protein n=1 Tax=Robertmurraya mangrovi TaxID=3098077 RepID=A0ABU5IYH6_9BACI|nr:YusU family protein [Bacillus sp. 31A1R]MDZ5472167.1 YusU family protein [Bacillus sp. 31A1R]